MLLSDPCLCSFCATKENGGGKGGEGGDRGRSIFIGAEGLLGWLCLKAVSVGVEC